MIRRISIVWVLLMSLMANAAVMTVTVETKSSATVSVEPQQDMPTNLAVLYSNTGSKGHVTSADSLMLSLSHWPACTIQQVTLNMASNTQSGAATITITMGEQSWQVAKGPYRDWPNIANYSTSAQPIPCLSKAIHLTEDASIQLQVRGQENSVYLQSIDIEYTLDPKQAHSVTLRWLDQHLCWQSSVLQEQSPEAGVILPQLSGEDSCIVVEDETWYWIGWSEQHIEPSSTEPLHWTQDDWYMPLQDGNLYALYTNAKTCHVAQDSTYQSDDYAIVCIDQGSAYLLAGAWNEGRIAMQSVCLDATGTGYYLSAPYLSNDARYQMTFEGDSVFIRHKATNQWISCNKTSPSSSRRQWTWRQSANHSVYLYNGDKSLVWSWIDYAYWGEYRTIDFNAKLCYWMLFPVADIPTTLTADYTTFAQMADVRTIPSVQPAVRKLWQQGQVIILFNQHKYNLLGQPL